MPQIPTSANENQRSALGKHILDQCKVCFCFDLPFDIFCCQFCSSGKVLRRAEEVCPKQTFWKFCTAQEKILETCHPRSQSSNLMSSCATGAI